MSRKRGIDAEQWTDPDFLACSPLARLFALALRNEADDNGLFEWNPAKLRLRLLPMDDCDPSALLAELAEHTQVARYEVSGKAYGAIRNFHKFQSPKYPSYRHPVPESSLGTGYEFRQPSRKTGGKQGEPSPIGVEVEVEVNSPNGEFRAEITDEPLLDAADDPVVLTFRCDGKPKTFKLHESKVREYENTYATINVREKLQHLWQWCEDNPSRRKTAKGMPAFLSRNLGREVDQKRDRAPYNGNGNGHAVEVDPQLLASIRGEQ